MAIARGDRGDAIQPRDLDRQEPVRGRCVPRLATSVGTPRPDRPVGAQGERMVAARGYPRSAGKAEYPPRRFVAHEWLAARAVAELSEIVGSPCPHTAVAAAREGEAPARRDLDHVLEAFDARRHGRSAPFPHAAVGRSGERIAPAGGDLNHVCQSRHRNRRRSLGGRPVADLPVRIASPGDDGAVFLQREDVGLAGGDRDDAGGPRDGCRQDGTERPPDPESATRVVTPRPDAPIRSQRDAVPCAGADRRRGSDRRQRHERDEQEA